MRQIAASDVPEDLRQVIKKSKKKISTWMQIE